MTTAASVSVAARSVAAQSVPADLLSKIPELRAFAISLCGNADQGDDLVQETLLSAWSHLDDFEPGTNMAAWLFTILRNRFLNECRRRRVWVDDADGQHTGKLATRPEQEGWDISADLGYALDHLPSQQREAVILVGAAGMTIAEAASVCGCEPGTIKSRVSRGRARLAAILAGEAKQSSKRTPDDPQPRVSARGSAVAARAAVNSIDRILTAEWRLASPKTFRGTTSGRRQCRTKPRFGCGYTEPISSATST